MPAKVKPVEQHADVTRGKNQMFTKKQRTQYQEQCRFAAYREELTWSNLGNQDSEMLFMTTENKMFLICVRDFHADVVPSGPRSFVELYFSRVCSQQLDGPCQVHLISPQASSTQQACITGEFLMSESKLTLHSVLCWIVENGTRDHHQVAMLIIKA